MLQDVSEFVALLLQLLDVLLEFLVVGLLLLEVILELLDDGSLLLNFKDVDIDLVVEVDDLLLVLDDLEISVDH